VEKYAPYSSTLFTINKLFIFHIIIPCVYLPREEGGPAMETLRTEEEGGGGGQRGGYLRERTVQWLREEGEELLRLLQAPNGGLPADETKDKEEST